MKRTHKQRVKKLQNTVLGNSLKLPTENKNKTYPVEVFQNGKHLIILT